MKPLSHCQLGFRPGSPKLLTLAPEPGRAGALPDRIPFYLHGMFDRIPRDRPDPAAWKGGFFRWPFDIEEGRLQPDRGRVLFRGELVRRESRWGSFWQGNFDAFQEEGLFQVETDFGSSFPIQIGARLYERIQQGYLNFLRCERSGFDNPGIRDATHLDDAVLDTTGKQIDASGGWYDAGDLRKWMFLTQPNLPALARIAERGHPGLRAAAVDEIRWGNRFFHSMIAPDGQVWEDVAGGTFKQGLDIEKDWWFENHPGCNCDNAGGYFTDNVPGSGDERLVRTRYNPAVQFLFVRTQCQAAAVPPPAEADRCRALAARAWDYGRRRGHDQRTLFVAEELWAALELHAHGMAGVDEVRILAETLLGRQDPGGVGLSGYFLERDGVDGFRCIALACDPALALVRLVELAPRGLAELCDRARSALTRHVDGYLLADAASNPFGVGPYGIYLDPPLPAEQRFRDAGRGRWVRTFLHPLNPQQIVHGTGAVVAHQAALCARAGRLLDRRDWREAGEKMIQWLLGHNPEGLCLHRGVGYRHPTPFSAYVAQLPDAISVGHIGRPDDSPYLETSPLVEWSSQEVWDVPHAHLAEAILWL